MERKASCRSHSAIALAQAKMEMIFGHNSNVAAGGTTFHVQTEDRGTTNALIDTTVYFHGRVLHRRTNNYFDLLPLDPHREQALKLRLDQQHRAVIEELRTGALHIPLPPGEIISGPAGARGASATSAVLSLELLNAKSWLTGKRALLQVAVRNGSQQAVAGAAVSARVEGAAEVTQFSAQSADLQRAPLDFGLPRLAGAEPALGIQASLSNSRVQLRFQLRGRPKVPSAS